MRHSRSPQNRYNIPVKGISGTSSVILSSTETYRLQAHFFIWKNQLQKTEPGLLGRLFGSVCPYACDRNVFWDWESYPEIGNCHVICFIMRRKAFFWLSFGRGHPSTKNVIFLAIGWFKSRSADHLIDNLCLWSGPQFLILLTEPVQPPASQKLYKLNIFILINILDHIIMSRVINQRVQSIAVRAIIVRDHVRDHKTVHRSGHRDKFIKKCNNT